jgi:hypothetical protein
MKHVYGVSLSNIYDKGLREHFRSMVRVDINRYFLSLTLSVKTENNARTTKKKKTICAKIKNDRGSETIQIDISGNFTLQVNPQPHKMPLEKLCEYAKDVYECATTNKSYNIYNIRKRYT